MKLSSSDDTKYIRSGLKASLIMVPVFGIHYMLYIHPFDPLELCSLVSFFMQHFMNVIEALQGAIVATIFCFLNQEVRIELKSKRLLIYFQLDSYIDEKIF